MSIERLCDILNIFWLRFMIKIFSEFIHIEAVDWRCSVKNVFLKISQNSQENTCVEVSFLIKLQAWLVTLLKKRFPVNFAKFLRTLFLRKFKLHRTSPVAASVNKIFHLCQVTSRIVSITRAIFYKLTTFFLLNACGTLIQMYSTIWMQSQMYCAFANMVFVF